MNKYWCSIRYWKLECKGTEKEYWERIMGIHNSMCYFASAGNWDGHHCSDQLEHVVRSMSREVKWLSVSRLRVVIGIAVTFVHHLATVWRGLYLLGLGVGLTVAGICVRSPVWVPPEWALLLWEVVWCYEGMSSCKTEHGATLSKRKGTATL
jgi:hypothetical protein